MIARSSSATAVEIASVGTRSEATKTPPVLPSRTSRSPARSSTSSACRRVGFEIPSWFASWASFGSRSPRRRRARSRPSTMCSIAVSNVRTVRIVSKEAGRPAPDAVCGVGRAAGEGEAFTCESARREQRRLLAPAVCPPALPSWSLLLSLVGWAGRRPPSLQCLRAARWPSRCGGPCGRGTFSAPQVWCYRAAASPSGTSDPHSSRFLFAICGWGSTMLTRVMGEIARNDTSVLPCARSAR